MREGPLTRRRALTSTLDEDTNSPTTEAERLALRQHALEQERRRDQAQLREGEELLGAYMDNEDTTPAEALRALVQDVFGRKRP